MAVVMSKPLKDLLLASNLGLNKNHPLAGWNVLTILYHDGSSSGVPITLDFLTRRYNESYLDTENDEAPISDNVLKTVLDVLSQQARLIEASARKIRARSKNGLYTTRTSYVYRITSSGIEYVKMMQRVLDAESTITANTNRIQEYCALVVKLSQNPDTTGDTALFNDFQNMISAYDDVMNGMHKLDDDLDELANDIAFNHGSAEAKHLQGMLNGKAIPAFKMMLMQGARIQALAHDPAFAGDVARSQQGTDDLDAANAVRDQDKLLTRFTRTRDYVRRQLAKLALSVDPSTSAIDSSLDSIYLVFHTILGAIKLLSEEYEHIQGQTVDVKALTAQIDGLLTHYQTLQVYTNLPRHLPADREIEDPEDLLDASTMGPVAYTATSSPRSIATAADNPVVAQDTYPAADDQAALAEFQRLVMRSTTHAVADHDLNFTTSTARDEVVRLYAATGYTSYASFAPFGRPVQAARALPDTGPIHLHCAGEQFSVVLPSGFTIDFG
ncbi:hypothetical protein [Schleiferilactobacillus harbinensis]|uniref:hypothetical protein n=1 Tax=Schleiferilactobacillus harbinensis TaxID=304207 RepID=UPI0024321EFB|nr:hypothetical protein [Schleiferilactobacillus harbinensis]MCI1688610.1 hypothetical protein [Schleiferilactobacillus harbinensis]MCI1783538.1 hypothetical protein [Schleiferilactobacillus harbinensis]MCI1849677.1 hypothetical protein [Schleiferilactobacillus harbinensis]